MGEQGRMGQGLGEKGLVKEIMGLRIGAKGVLEGRTRAICWIADGFGFGWRWVVGS